MHLADTTEPAEGRTMVLGPSLALDLSWAIHAVGKPSLREAQPVLGDLYARRPELAEAIRGFWPDELRCFTELEVLAAWAGALEVDDLGTLLRILSSSFAGMPPDLPLESETERDREIVLGRLADLRRSPALRRRWEELLTDLWTELDESWRRSGIPLVERAALDARAKLDRGTDWLQLVGTRCDSFQAHLPQIVERHRAGLTVLMVPCAFFGKALYLELPSCIVIGLSASGDAMARARTAEVARRLRVVADPTRLAILDHLADGSRSVGEIARSFSLAQPTVSSHVKHLREAGLVSSTRHGARVEVSLNRDAVETLAGELGTLLVR